MENKRGVCVSGLESPSEFESQQYIRGALPRLFPPSHPLLEHSHTRQFFLSNIISEFLLVVDFGVDYHIS